MNANQRLSVCAALLLAAAFSLFLLAPPHVLAQPQVQFFDKPTDARAFIGHMNGKWYFRSQLSLHVFNDQFQHVSSAKLKWPKAWKKVVVEDVRIVGDQIIALGSQSDPKLKKREFVRFRWEESGAVVPLAEKGMPVVASVKAQAHPSMANTSLHSVANPLFAIGSQQSYRRFAQSARSRNNKWHVVQHLQVESADSFKFIYLVFDSTLAFKKRLEEGVAKEAVQDYTDFLSIENQGTIVHIVLQEINRRNELLNLHPAASSLLYRRCGLEESKFKKVAVKVEKSKILSALTHEQSGKKSRLVIMAKRDENDDVKPHFDRLVIYEWDEKLKALESEYDVEVWELDPKIKFDDFYSATQSGLTFDLLGLHIDDDGLHLAFADRHVAYYPTSTRTMGSAYSGLALNSAIHSTHVFCVHLTQNIKKINRFTHHRRLTGVLSSCRMLAADGMPGVRMLFNERFAPLDEEEPKKLHYMNASILSMKSPPFMFFSAASGKPHNQRLLPDDPKNPRSIATTYPMYSLGQGRFLVFFLNKASPYKCVPAILKF